jgi:hypothetical protein
LRVERGAAIPPGHQKQFEEIVTAILWTQIIAGVLLLLLGRRILWLFLGILGFFVTRLLALTYLPDLSGQTTLIIALAGGGLAASLILLAEKLAVTGGGVLGGAFVGAFVWQQLVPGAGGMPWIGIVAGAILGFLIVRFVVKLALAIMASAVGAALLALALPEPEYRMIAFVVLLIVGLVLQSGLLRKKKDGEHQDQ